MMVSVKAIPAVILGLVALGLAAATGPSAAGAALIKVNAPGNDPRGVILETSELGVPDVNSIDYPLSGANTRPVTGWSLRKVLNTAAARPEAAGWLDASKMPSVSLAPPSTNVGAQIKVSSSEILDQGIFGGGRTPVFEDNDDGSINFIKPGVNGSPGVAYRYSVSVEIRVERDPTSKKRLGLKISPSRIEQGDRVSFRVTVPGGSGSGLTFAWTIREVESGRTFATSTRGESLSRTFARKGSYTVLVSAIGSSTLDPAVGSFLVGVKPTPEKRPDQQDSGGGDSQSAGTPVTPSGAGLPPTISSSGGSGAGAGFGLDAPSPDPKASDRKTDRVPDGLEQVSGELIGPNVEVIEVPPEEFASQGAGPSEIEDGPGFLGGVAGEAATLLGVGLLMALGGLLELRVLSRRG